MSKKEKMVANVHKSRYNKYGEDISYIGKLNPNYTGVKEDRERDGYKSDDIKKLENVFRKINPELFMSI